jgi:hypothetical protein
MNTGWAQRANRHSIVWHYFVAGVSICAKQWTDGQRPFVVSVVNGKCCPRCVDLRKDVYDIAKG